MVKSPSRRPERAGSFPISDNSTGADTQSEAPDIAFFLGAGASVDASIPTTVQFVKSFLDSPKEPEQQTAVQQLWISSTIGRHGNVQPERLILNCFWRPCKD